MITKKQITMEEIEAKKAEHRKIGMASFTINGMSEDDSIRQVIAESWSVCYCAIRDPYHGSRGKVGGNIRFKVFQIIKEKPQIPMGYSGMPGFDFECHDGEPLKKCVSILKKKFDLKWSYKMNKREDEVTCIPVLSEEEKEKKTQAEKTKAEKYQVKEDDSDATKAIKLEIAKLEAQGLKMKAINKALKSGSDEKLEALGLSQSDIIKVKTPDFCGRVGFPGYQLTSVASKVRRLKSKIRA